MKFNQQDEFGKIQEYEFEEITSDNQYIIGYIDGSAAQWDSSDNIDDHPDMDADDTVILGPGDHKFIDPYGSEFEIIDGRWRETKTNQREGRQQ